LTSDTHAQEHEITRLLEKWFFVGLALTHLSLPTSDFLWSPKEYRIFYWVPEMGQIPAKIIIVEIPSRKEISTKSRHLVSDVSDNACDVWTALLGDCTVY